MVRYVRVTAPYINATYCTLHQRNTLGVGIRNIARRIISYCDNSYPFHCVLNERVWTSSLTMHTRKLHQWRWRGFLGCLTSLLYTYKRGLFLSLFPEQKYLQYYFQSIFTIYENTFPRPTSPVALTSLAEIPKTLALSWIACSCYWPRRKRQKCIEERSIVWLGVQLSWNLDISVCSLPKTFHLAIWPA